MGGTVGPYPQPYTMQEEQRVQPRIEKPVSANPETGLLKVVVALAVLTILIILGLVVF